MKIAQVITSKGWGGAEKVFVDLCNELSKNAEVIAITYANEAITKRLDPRVIINVIPFSNRYDPRCYWHIGNIIKKYALDVVHSHCAKASQIIHISGYFFKINHVATKHNTRKAKIFEKICNVTAVSVSSAASVKKGATVIYNGISPSDAVLESNPSKTFKMLAVGRLDPIKGFDHLIDQAATINIDYELEIAGDGPQRDVLQIKINEKNLNDKIKLTGYCDNIPAKMSDVDLVVISSSSEGFSLVLAEAIFYSKMLISTKVGVAPEILHSSLLVEQSHIMMKAVEVATNYELYCDRFRLIQEKNRNRFEINNVSNLYLEYYQLSL